ncbi:MAG: FAD-binding oxidoreductase [Parachlamydia sp.]|nr:FAD-binding oxidoreductase [Parachlamydia sp.]
MKTIAIIGAGFCGLASAWELLQEGHEVHIYDPSGIAGGASGVSAGLLHPFTGIHANLAEWGREGVASTLELIRISSQTLGTPVAEESGMLRLALTEEMRADFLSCASQHEDVDWLEPRECQHLVPNLKALPGICIRSALTVRSALYLRGLWLACEQSGATLIPQPVTSLSSLLDYDLVITAMGASIASLPELRHLPIRPIKGQVLELAWPQDIAPLALPLNSLAYLVMQPGGQSCLAGATFERDFSTPLPVPEAAFHEIMPKIAAFYPALSDARLIGCRAGLRASAPGHKPLLKQVDAKTWVLTGMGSKGLLYHALFAKRLCQKVQCC